MVGFNYTRFDQVTTISPRNITDVMIVLSADDILPNDFSVPLRIVFILLYAIIIVSAILGNLALIVVVASNPALRTVTNMFLMSLALSDVLIAVWNMPFQISFYVHNEWLLGEVMCKLTRYLQGVNIVSSAFALTGIAFERYYAICHPIRARHLRSMRTTLTLLGVMWAVCFALLIPQIFLQKLKAMVKIDENMYPPVTIAFVCVEVFHEQYSMMVYTFFFYIVLYLLPLAIMLGTYGKITHRLWVSQPIGDALSNPQHHLRHIHQKKKIVKTLIAVVVLFAVCWFPFFTAQIYSMFHQLTTGFRKLSAVFQLIGYLNCCLNPILYAFMNDTFRRFLCASIFGHCKFRRKDNSNISVTMDTGV